MRNRVSILNLPTIHCGEWALRALSSNEVFYSMTDLGFLPVPFGRVENFFMRSLPNSSKLSQSAGFSNSQVIFKR
jgi:hypothetical protein